MAKAIKPAAGNAAGKSAKTAPDTAPKAAGTAPKSQIKSSIQKTKAAGSPLSQSVVISFDFNSGVGQVSASLYRLGSNTPMQESKGTDIQFDNVQKGDIIGVTGICTGSADVKINLPTTPGTPDHFSGNIIMGSYRIN